MTIEIYITGKFLCPHCGANVELPEHDVRQCWRRSNFTDSRYIKNVHYRFFCCPVCKKLLLRVEAGLK